MQAHEYDGQDAAVPVANDTEQVQSKAKSKFWDFEPLVLKPLSTNTLLFMVAAVAFAIYAVTLGHNFVFDDSGSVVHNKSVHKGILGIPEIFTQLSWQTAKSTRKLANFNIYRPMSYSFFALQYQIWGASNVLFHLVTVLLYSGVCVCIYLFLERLTEQKYPYLSLLVTLLYALHPAHTEVVCNVKSQDELLSMLLGTSAVLLFLKGHQDKNRNSLIASFCAFLAAAFCKENGIFWWPIIGLAAYYGLRKNIWQSLLLMLPYLIPVGIYLTARYFVRMESTAIYQHSGYDNPIFFAQTVSQELGMRFWAWGTAIWQLLVPHKLKLFYHYNDVPMTEVTDWQSIVSLSTVLILLVVGVWGLIKRYWLAFGIAFFGAHYAIFTQVPSPIANIFGERWLFTPSLGYCFVIGTVFYGLASLMMARKKENPSLSISLTPLYVLLGLILTLYSIRTFTRSLDWQSEYKLFSKECENSPNTYIAHRNAYIACENKLKHEKTAELVAQFEMHLRKSIEVRPMGVAYEKLAQLEFEKNNLKEAMACYEQHLKLGGGNINKSKIKLASCRNLLGLKFEETAKMLEPVDKVKFEKKDQIEVYHEFGIALKNIAMQKGDSALYDSAYIQFNRARMADEKDKNKDTDVYMSFIFKDMGDCEMAMKLYKRAEQTYYHAINLNGNNHEAYLGASNALKALNDEQRSKAFYFKYLQMTGQPLPAGLH